ncbi:MAG: ATP-dependent sacrificial sulfur transferase LarE [Nitrospirota bacterium]|nr:MAG: ATP-dependent sacrificial sulfur transferase LarE [Nitrospirota bacterium]
MEATPALQEKYLDLQNIFDEMGSTLVAFSGGIDSTLVLKAAYTVLGDRALAVTAVSPTFPDIELKIVRQVIEEIGAPLRIVQTDQLMIDDFVRNDANRCFHCKTDLYQLLQGIQQEMGFHSIVDGTNVDDLQDDRPGIQAARALGVRSPLVEAGFGKGEIRALANFLDLSNWNKPAAACLSSRVPRGVPITRAALSRVEQAEALLFDEGFSQVRVRDHEGIARIEVEGTEIMLFSDEQRRDRIADRLKKLGFRFVTVDLEGYRSGSANFSRATRTPGSSSEK